MRRTVTALALAAAIAPCGRAQAIDLATMRERTATIATRYLQVWSSNDEASVAGVPYVYAERVLFYGRPYGQAQLMAEKRRAIRQWPERRYVHRPGSMRVTCDETRQTCTARSVYDFAVANPARGTSKRGSARFELGIGFDGPTPRILSEGGSTGRRG